MYKDNCQNRIHEKGIALIAVLWVVVLLTIIIAIVAKASLIDTRVTMVSAEQVRSKWACTAGIENAIAVLSDDDKGYDSYVDLWYYSPADFNSIELDQCIYDVMIVDEASKLNLNTVTKEQLMFLSYMTEEIADSILDWRDSDDTIRPGGAEAGYYINLPHGYEIRNGDFKSVRELLRVKDITNALLYGSEDHSGWANYLTCYSYDSSVDAEGNNKININSADQNQLASDLGISRGQAQWIVENRNYQSIGDLLTNNSPDQPSGGGGGGRNQSQPLDRQTFFEIADKITTAGQGNVAGKINLNTASEFVLLALFEFDEDIVNEIITYRSSSETGFAGLSDLGEIKSFDNSNVKKYIDKITVRSSVFTIISKSTSLLSNSKGYAKAVVDRSKSPVEIIYYHTGVDN